MTYAEFLTYAIQGEQAATTARKPRKPRTLPRRAVRGGRGGETRYAISASRADEL